MLRFATSPTERLEETLSRGLRKKLPTQQACDRYLCSKYCGTTANIAWEFIRIFGTTFEEESNRWLHFRICKEALGNTSFHDSGPCIPNRTSHDTSSSIVNTVCVLLISLSEAVGGFKTNQESSTIQ